MGTTNILIREMTIEDYEQVYEPWTDAKGSGIRSINDSREEMERFLKRNPATSVVAVQDGLIIGNILREHNGRTGCFYHVCVVPRYRKRRTGYRMVQTVMEALQHEGVSEVSLTVFENNKMGNAFQQRIGWTEREDVSSYELILNKESITRFVR